MGFKCGIVGLPNIGKSTLFNALTKTSAAAAENYPFCTIDPNIGEVNVPDERLLKLADIAKSQKTIPTKIHFVDIAGLVKGASKGEGLGNQFLSHIREVDAIINVVRLFKEKNVTHVEGSIDAIRDMELIESELMIADLESLEKRLPNMEKKLKTNASDKDLKIKTEIVNDLIKILAQGKPARTYEKIREREKEVRELGLITSKPVLVVFNVAEEDVAFSLKDISPEVADFTLQNNINFEIISAKIESEIALLENEEEKLQFLEALGLQETGLSKIIKGGYQALNLITYFTVGPKEARAWTVKKGSLAPSSAGVIHSDFERGFIKAETVYWQDFVNIGGWAKCFEAGKVRFEGKDYETKDGDIFNFKFNV